MSKWTSDFIMPSNVLGLGEAAASTGGSSIDAGRYGAKVRTVREVREVREMREVRKFETFYGVST